jgi:aconitate hydratase
LHFQEGDVVTVREVSGLTVTIRLSANPGLRDFWIVSEIIKRDFPEISFDVNPSSISIRKPNGNGSFRPFAAGGRLHQSGCMGCIGMGQAPATNISLRTMPEIFRDVPALDDKIYLCSQKLPQLH